eukprot:Sdes_comp10355_c0_seq1m1999
MKYYLLDSNIERCIRNTLSLFITPILHLVFSNSGDDFCIDKIIRARPDLDSDFVEQFVNSRMICTLVDSWTREDFEFHKFHVEREREYIQSVLYPDGENEKTNLATQSSLSSSSSSSSLMELNTTIEGAYANPIWNFEVFS